MPFLTRDAMEAVVDAAIDLVEELNTYEGIAQVDEQDRYGRETALGMLNQALDVALGICAR